MWIGRYCLLKKNSDELYCQKKKFLLYHNKVQISKYLGVETNHDKLTLKKCADDWHFNVVFARPLSLNQSMLLLIHLFICYERKELDDIQKLVWKSWILDTAHTSKYNSPSHLRFNNIHKQKITISQQLQMGHKSKNRTNNKILGKMTKFREASWNHRKEVSLLLHTHIYTPFTPATTKTLKLLLMYLFWPFQNPKRKGKKDKSFRSFFIMKEMRKKIPSLNHHQDMSSYVGRMLS